MKLVIVDNYDSFTFNLLQLLGTQAGERPIVVKNDEMGPREIEALDPAGVVLSPGPGHPREAGRLIEIARDLDPKIPLLGVCLGHQAIVESEGGKVVGANVIVHGKTSDVHHDGGVLFEGIPSPCIATRYHSLVAQRETLPSTLKENARTTDGLIMAVEHVERPVFGVQFHPESIATALGARMLANFADFCRRRTNVERPLAREEGLGPLLERILSRENLSRDMALSLGERILTGQLTPAQVGALALALHAKGETAEELVGFSLALQRAAPHLTPKKRPINIGGTGADRCRTFNITTAAAFVVAGAGVPVTKWTEVRKSSRAGSADVIRALGVHLSDSAAHLTALLDDVGLAFVTPTGVLHDRIPGATEIGVRSIFSLTAPLINPARAKRHLLGVFSDAAREEVVRAVKALGAERALVVHGTDGLDELTTTAPVRATELLADGRVVERTIDAQQFGLPRATVSDLFGGDAAANARIILDVLEGNRGPQRDIVVLNAAAALVTSGSVTDIELGLVRASESIDSGAARRILSLLQEQSAG